MRASSCRRQHEGYDAVIGGGFELSPGMVSRTLAPAHNVAVAAPAYLAGRAAPQNPSQLNALDCWRRVRIVPFSVNLPTIC